MSFCRVDLMRNSAYTQMNRPFGAVDVSANLKGAVPKAATQKIMVALAERGDLVQKTYGMHTVTDNSVRQVGIMTCTGKTTFFVANQANLEDMPSEKLAALEAEVKRIGEENKSLGAEVKSIGAGTVQLAPSPLCYSFTLFV